MATVERQRPQTARGFEMSLREELDIQDEEHSGVRFVYTEAGADVVRMTYPATAVSGDTGDGDAKMAASASSGAGSGILTWNDFLARVAARRREKEASSAHPPAEEKPMDEEEEEEEEEDAVVEEGIRLGKRGRPDEGANPAPSRSKSESGASVPVPRFSETVATWRAQSNTATLTLPQQQVNGMRTKQDAIHDELAVGGDVPYAIKPDGRLASIPLGAGATQEQKTVAMFTTNPTVLGIIGGNLEQRLRNTVTFIYPRATDAAAPLPELIAGGNANFGQVHDNGHTLLVGQNTLHPGSAVDAAPKPIVKFVSARTPDAVYTICGKDLGFDETKVLGWTLLRFRGGLQVCCIIHLPEGDYDAGSGTRITADTTAATLVPVRINGRPDTRGFFGGRGVARSGEDRANPSGLSDARYDEILKISKTVMDMFLVWLCRDVGDNPFYGPRVEVWMDANNNVIGARPRTLLVKSTDLLCLLFGNMMGVTTLREHATPSSGILCTLTYGSLDPATKIADMAGALTTLATNAGRAYDTLKANLQQCIETDDLTISGTNRMPSGPKNADAKQRLRDLIDCLEALKKRVQSFYTDKAADLARTTVADIREATRDYQVLSTVFNRLVPSSPFRKRDGGISSPIPVVSLRRIDPVLDDFFGDSRAQKVDIVIDLLRASTQGFQEGQPKTFYAAMEELGIDCTQDDGREGTSGKSGTKTDPVGDQGAAAASSSSAESTPGTASEMATAALTYATGTVPGAVTEAAAEPPSEFNLLVQEGLASDLAEWKDLQVYLGTDTTTVAVLHAIVANPTPFLAIDEQTTMALLDNYLSVRSEDMEGLAERQMANTYRPSNTLLALFGAFVESRNWRNARSVGVNRDGVLIVDDTVMSEHHKNLEKAYRTLAGTTPIAGIEGMEAMDVEDVTEFIPATGSRASTGESSEGDEDAASVKSPEKTQSSSADEGRVIRTGPKKPRADDEEDGDAVLSESSEGTSGLPKPPAVQKGGPASLATLTAPQTSTLGSFPQEGGRFGPLPHWLSSF